MKRIVKNLMQMKRIMEQMKRIPIWLLPFFVICCSDYLDVVPDNVATVDNAFAMRSQAEKYLFTCYSYMPKDGDPRLDPAIEGGDEIWRILINANSPFDIARGFQNVVNPIRGNLWQDLYKALRDCNIFLENIDRVPDLDETEKKQWIAEVKFLKAYFHFYLVRMYGPIPLIKENLPISADVNKVKVCRAPVDSCFNYIVELIDEAVPDLLLNTLNMQQDAGRITKVIALSFKAKVMVTAASPLFNGNEDQATLKNLDGTALFNTTYSKAKWDSAVVACKRALEVCEEAGLKLYKHPSNYQQFNLTDTIQTQLSIRNSVCERWNSEIIWANTQSYCNVQILALPVMDTRYLENYLPHGELSPPLKIAEMFYSQNGIPIDEDKTWDYEKRYNLRSAGDNEGLYVRKNYVTANLNFNREPRFYAALGFDGGVWYGQGNYNDKDPSSLFYLQAKWRQLNAIQPDRNSITGYFLKKLIHFETVIGSGTSYFQKNYPWPIMRLADLYLLYAEALNESRGPDEEVYRYINLVRERAGLPTVESAWSNYSVNPNKFTSQDGLRDIIHRERLIELVFEGHRFWDLRRWKKSAKVLNSPIRGWNVSQEVVENYYTPITIFNQRFGIKDYFWPIADEDITINRNLIQNLGW